MIVAVRLIIIKNKKVKCSVGTTSDGVIIFVQVQSPDMHVGFEKRYPVPNCL